MPDAGVLAVLTLGIVAAAMVAEFRISRRNELALRARGAVEPADDVHPIMQVAYPMCFLVMIAEGAAISAPGPRAWAVGGGVFLVAKALKYWAIASLASRWTFRVLVLAGEPLVTRGPYRWMTHPNYIAVIGELVGVAIMMQAIRSGPAAVVGFGALLARRIGVENRALGRL